MSKKLGIFALFFFSAIFLIFFLGIEKSAKNAKNSKAQIEEKPTNSSAGLNWRKLEKDFPKFKNSTLSASRFFIEKDFKNQCFLLNIWATWCKECLLEHNLLLELQKNGVKILGLNYKDELQNAKNWLAQKGDPFVENLVEPANFIGLAFDLGVTGAPETFLVNKNKKIILHKLGALQKNDLNFLVQKMQNCH